MKKFDLKDISIIPTVVSPINSRRECIVEDENGFLPLIASPMDTVVCSKNLQVYIDNKIIPCMPRGDNKHHMIGKPFYFQAFGLCEIEQQLKINYDNYAFYTYHNVLIDIANGHMGKLIDIVKEIKDKYPHINLMVGNVAHPLTYKNLAMAGADSIRVSIGSGAGCTTAANVAINYPLGSLISECYEIKRESGLRTKIVADGGMRGYDDIIKALALGSDQVMIGSLFNKTMQSAGFNYLYRIKLPYNIAKTFWKWGFPIKKKYRGMSTKSVQRKWGKTELVTAEGITKYQKVEYNLSQWTQNFKDYLRSCMSYCGSNNLNEFIGKVEWEFITNKAFERFNK